MRRLVKFVLRVSQHQSVYCTSYTLFLLQCIKSCCHSSRKNMKWLYVKSSWPIDKGWCHMSDVWNLSHVWNLEKKSGLFFLSTPIVPFFRMAMVLNSERKTDINSQKNQEQHKYSLSTDCTVRKTKKVLHTYTAKCGTTSNGCTNSINI